MHENNRIDTHPRLSRAVDTRIPELIRPLLQAYMHLLETKLPGLVTGLYLHGSVALDAFNAAHSDIDFVALLNRRCSESDVESLEEIHCVIAASYPRWKLEGSYLQWQDLGQAERAIAPHPIYHDGELQQMGHFDVNWVTWWVLKNRGIALIGREPNELNFTVDWRHLITDMRQNLNTYWADFTTKPQRIVWLFSDYGIQWTVLGVLRQYYSFMEQDITSKTGAGEYALAHLPTGWHPLIREAIHLREQASGSLYESRIIRALEAYNFLRYIIRLSNAQVSNAQVNRNHR